MATKYSTTKSQSGTPVFIVLGLAALAGAYFFFAGPKGPGLSQHLSNRPSVDQMKNGDFKIINEDNPGEKIELSKFRAFGKYTIFDFQSAYCGPCREMTPHLLELTKARPDIAVRSVDINRKEVQGIDWDSPVCQQYGIHSVPSFRIYGPGGKELASGGAARDQVRNCINEELMR